MSASSAALRNAGCSVTYAGALSYSRDTPCTCTRQESRLIGGKRLGRSRLRFTSVANSRTGPLGARRACLNAVLREQT